MEISGGIQASLSGRYATALFDLARESKAIDKVEKSLALLEAAIGGSDDLKRLISSPLVRREQAVGAVAAVAKTLKLDAVTGNFLGVLAQNGRLSQATNVIRAFRMLAAAHRGETTAEVTSAHALSDAQLAALKTQLKARTGRDVAVQTRVDPEILGGLTVKLGSQLIDSSLRTKLNTLAHAMKG
ncbi:ATP synthase subunit delta [Sphingomonas antarctica]|uniref:F0F1 ATP synthase subunit delta n=1 Tax=Sphingomonas antarctica TaxID=2040274 RepID=UPI0039EA9A6E